MKSASGHAWPVKRLRFLTQQGLSNKRRKVLADATRVTFLPMENIGEQGEIDCSITRNIEDVRNGYTQFFDGDVLVAKITPCFENGKGALVRDTLSGVGFGTTELHVLAPTDEIDARFLYYVTVSNGFRGHGEASMFGSAGQKRVPEDFVRDYRVPIPPLARQRAIADYLDREAARLDTLLAAKERMLELLAERRQTLIAAAVTGGTDSTGQPEPTAPGALREEGGRYRIATNGGRGRAFVAGGYGVRFPDWIENLPAQWEAKPLRSIASYIVSNVDKLVSDDEIQVRLCNYTDVYYNEFVTLELDFMNATASLDEIEKFSLSVGDVIITKDSESWDDIGVPALVRETAADLVCGYHLALLRPHEKIICGSFLFRCLQAKPIQLQLEISARGVTRFGLSKSEIGATMLPVPPLARQRAIADYLDRETARLDELAARIERTIALLEERRAALVAAAVTGRIDVASAA